MTLFSALWLALLTALPPATTSSRGAECGTPEAAEAHAPQAATGGSITAREFAKPAEIPRRAASQTVQAVSVLQRQVASRTGVTWSGDARGPRLDLSSYPQLDAQHGAHARLAIAGAGSHAPSAHGGVRPFDGTAPPRPATGDARG